MKGGLGSYKIRGVLELLRVYKSKPVVKSSDSSVVVVGGTRPRIYGFRNSQLDGLRFIHAAGTSSGGGMVNDGTQSILPPLPPPPSSRRPPSPPRRGNFPMWAKLVLGSVFSLLLALWSPNWTTLLKIGGEAEVVIKDAEQAAEVVEKVAAVVEKVSEEVADILPDGNKFKEAALIVDHVSKETAKNAQIVDELLHKLDAVKQDIKDVEETIKPMIDEIEHDSKSNKQVKS
ncbi:hypothetical protein RND81_14G201900 [Saponaria officinalis]|uniref:Uncharacterized protein n=1 Tax=Saponaria officinalis TaxID=3572 RepID=A0AAW1GSP6_SAPOF